MTTPQRTPIHRTPEGKLKDWVKVLATVLAALGIPSGGVAIMRVLDLDTVTARAMAVDSLRSSFKTDLGKATDDANSQFEILDSKLNCVLQGIPFEKCPASNWRR